MATTNIGNDLELAQIDFQRKQQLADALRHQSQQSLQGQMVGNHYVSPNFTQYLAKIINGYQAGEMERENLADLRNARQAYDTRGQGEMQNFMSAMRGTPASESQNVAPDEYGQMTNQPIQNPAQAPDQAKALALALQSKNPMLQTMGGKLLENQLTPKLQVVGRSLLNQEGKVVGTDPTVEAERLAKTEEAQRAQRDKIEAAKELAKQRSIDAEAARAANEALRRDLAGQNNETRRALREAGNKPPAGYRYLPDGNMEAVPGGPADIKAQNAAAIKATGATDVDAAVGTLRNAYDRLESGGGITSTNKGAIANAGSALSSSGLGQVVGKTFGTNNQSARNDIEMTRPALLASLMKATGMSAKQMDSNAELKLWMKTATDPTLDVESNRRALDSIERKYLGANKPIQSSPNPADMQAAEWAKANPKDPRAAAIKQRLGL